MRRYEFMVDHVETYPIRVLASTLGVSPSGFYDWRDRPVSVRRRRRTEIEEVVTEIYAEHGGIPGSRKIQEELVRRKIDVCRNTVAATMCRKGLKSKAQRHRKFVVTTDSDHDDPIAPKILDRDFTADAPNRKWLADITFVRVDLGWAYVATVMDLFSRRIVGWSVSDSCDEALVLEALGQALELRRPAPGLLYHSDRGSTYTAAEHRRRLAASGIQCSMSRVGNCWDNACAERFFCSYKNEWTNHRHYADIEAVRQDTFKYIEIYYNRKRRHQALGYLTPAEFESRHQESTAA